MGGTFTWSKISEFDAVSWDENIFWLDISMEDAFVMNVVDDLQELIHVDFDLVCLETLISDQAFVEVLLHEFEDQRELTWLRVEVPVGSS